MKHLLIIYHSKDGSTGKMADAVLLGAEHPDIDVEVNRIVAKEAGLDELREADERQSRVAELKYFSDLGFAEISAHLGVSLRTAKSDWTKARAFLSWRLTQEH